MPVLRRSLRWIAVAPFAGLASLWARTVSYGKRGPNGTTVSPVVAVETRVVALKPRPKGSRRPLDPTGGAVILPFQRRAPALVDASDPPARTGSL